MQTRISGVLTDREIVDRLADKNDDFWIEPMLHAESQITGCKVDLHLSGIFYEIKQSTFALYDPLSRQAFGDYRRRIILPLGVPYTLHPGMFVLAPTYENVSMPSDLLGILEGRSSLGRLGVIVHCTASLIDPGYKGTITLELSNSGQMPLNLYALSRIATISFIPLRTRPKRIYGDFVPYPTLMEMHSFRHGKYDSVMSQPSKFHEDWEHKVLQTISKQRSSQKMNQTVRN